MSYWRDLLGGLLLWTAHFFVVYGIASILPGTGAAAVLVVLITAVTLAITAYLLMKELRVKRASDDDLQRWSANLALLGYALAIIAIAYQGLFAALIGYW